MARNAGEAQVGAEKSFWSILYEFFRPNEETGCGAETTSAGEDHFKRDRMRKRRLEETQVSYRQGVTYWDVMCMSPFLMEDACECSIWKGENELFPLQRLMHVL